VEVDASRVVMISQSDAVADVILIAAGSGEGSAVAPLGR
jgi:hypothetical protein